VELSGIFADKRYSPATQGMETARRIAAPLNGVGGVDSQVDWALQQTYSFASIVRSSWSKALAVFF
jgi:hypothetical protein